MRKATRNYLVALIMFLLALFEVVSGFVLWLVLPRGRGYMGGRGGGLIAEATFLWPRDTWIEFHIGWPLPFWLWWHCIWFCTGGG